MLAAVAPGAVTNSSNQRRPRYLEEQRHFET
jgi:hypothetical protein